MSTKFAYRINELVAQGPLGRSALFEAIRSGDLMARKYGRTTIVLTADWLRFLENLPERAVKGSEGINSADIDAIF